MSASLEGNSSAVEAAPSRGRWIARLALLRIPQWSKNAFVLAPVFFSKKLGSLDAVGTSFAAAMVFALFSSAVYTLNDYMDRFEDLQNPLKRRRPLASGELGLQDAVLLGVGCVLLASAIGLIVGLPTAFWATIGAYLAIQIAYSICLRNVVLVDVTVIAAGFVLRVLAGTTALRVEASSFIVLASGLLALLLALGKRRSDLNLETAAARPSLQGYTIEFIDLAVASLAAAVIGFYAEFTVSGYSARRFGTTHLYLTTFLVALGVIRYLQVIVAEQRLGSPTDIVLRDRPMQAIIACWFVMFAAMAYG
jgi:decaprenyl-phosphate phosphoribosyltransferase